MFLIITFILLTKKPKKVFNSALTIKDLILLQLKINTQYRLYIRLLKGLIKLSCTLSLILLPLLTAFKYKKVINGKPHSQRASANLNIPLCPLAYIIV